MIWATPYEGVVDLDRIVRIAVDKGELGLRGFDQQLLTPSHADQISGTQALRSETKPAALAMTMRGIKRIRGIASH